MTQQELSQLQPGDLITTANTGELYTVIHNNNGTTVAAPSTEVSNASNWGITKKQAIQDKPTEASQANQLISHKPQEYQPELITIKKDDLLAAIGSLRTSLEYLKESKLHLASNQHISTRILTKISEATNNDMDAMKSTIANLNNYLLNRNK
jgi:hypothetical protein